MIRKGIIIGMFVVALTALIGGAVSDGKLVNLVGPDLEALGGGQTTYELALFDRTLHFARDSLVAKQTPRTDLRFAGFAYYDAAPWHVDMETVVLGTEFHAALKRGAAVGRPYCRITVLRIPLWVLLVMFSIYPVVAFIRGPLRRWRRRKHNQCVHCGYNLSGLPEPRCPECGQAT